MTLIIYLTHGSSAQRVRGPPGFAELPTAAASTAPRSLRDCATAAPCAEIWRRVVAARTPRRAGRGRHVPASCLRRARRLHDSALAVRPFGRSMTARPTEAARPFYRSAVWPSDRVRAPGRSPFPVPCPRFRFPFSCPVMSKFLPSFVLSRRQPRPPGSPGPQHTAGPRT